MPYTIRYSDLTKSDTVTVPDMPPGINTVDTSLALVGRGYPNYGQKIAENFVHLLENFSGPIPPNNPIEGQLWYDTSNSNNKVLRIMDGTSSTTRWRSANGIYQQSEDPAGTSTEGLKKGDIWVDTASNQLKIFVGDIGDPWDTIGPHVINTGEGKTGPEVETILDNGNIEHLVIKNWASGKVVSIIAGESFVPKTVILGFGAIKAGINLSNDVGDNISTVLNGTALFAKSLVDITGLKISADSFLRKDDDSVTGQVITGKVKFIVPDSQTTTSDQSNFGVVIANTSDISDPNYLQLYKSGNDAILLNNVTNGKVIIKTKSNNLSPVMELDNSTTKLSSNTVNVEGNLSVAKNLSVTGTLTARIFPSGVIMAYGSVSPIPDGWLLCDGHPIPTAEYEDLFAVIGYTFGSSESGYFNLPNYVTTTVDNKTIYHIIKT